jgi:signal transduction histidine kinase
VSAQLRAVVETIEDPVCVLDAAGQAVLSNEAMTMLVGAPLTSDSTLQGALGTDDSVLASSEEDRARILRVGERWFELHVRQVTSDAAGSPERLVLVHDVTEVRRQLASREAFIGVLSHELRTPVTTILGLAKILARPTSHLTPQERTELLGDIASEGERMHRLVEDLLVLSRADGTRLEYEQEPVLVQRAIPPIVAAEADRYPHLRFVADIDPDLPPVAGDQTFVEQILRNMIGNAAKYSPDSPSEVRVAVRRTSGEVRVSVLDRGPGIDPDEADQLFDLFYRASGSALRPGAGIGLYVTKTLATAMGGRVWASVRDGGGAEFGVALPVMVVEPAMETG